jgi:hypothetical protein
MAITLGSSSISGLAAGGLGAGTVTSTTLADSTINIGNMGITGTVIQVAGGGIGSSGGYISQNWSGGGSANNWYDHPSLLYATITPKYSNSIIIIMVNLGNTWSQNGTLFRIWNNTSNTNIVGSNYGNTSGISNPGGGWWQSIPSVSDTNHGDSACWMGYDTPGTTSAVQYKTQAYGEGSSLYLNYGPSNPDNAQAYSARHTSNMILLEIKQ